MIPALGFLRRSSQFVEVFGRIGMCFGWVGKGKAGRTLLRSALHMVDEYHAANEVKAGNRTEAAPMVTW